MPGNHANGDQEQTNWFQGDSGGNDEFVTALPFRSKLYAAEPNYVVPENACARIKIDAINVTQSHIFILKSKA
ncbi:hypothetical protein [Burkholderia cepacia]|uniref:hypothetical protein n=1 Tax=Burkholderia cepacia TaxID=292 RepID=UPI0029904CE6|nr:hypothetical protein [Burkholderia cepacia]